MRFGAAMRLDGLAACSKFADWMLRVDDGSCGASVGHILVFGPSPADGLDVTFAGRSERIAVQADQIAFVPAGGAIAWGRGSSARWRTLTLTLNPVLLRHLAAEQIRSAGNLMLLRPTVVQDPIMSAMGRWLESEAAAGAPSRITLEAVATVLALRLLNGAERQAASTTRGGLAGWRVRRVTDHLSANLSRDVRLKDMAVLVELSTHHFSRAFRAATGMPPHRYLMKLRLERARELLHGRELTLTEIALETGFSDQSHLSRAFRAEFGIRPATFRNRSVGNRAHGVEPITHLRPAPTGSDRWSPQVFRSPPLAKGLHPYDP
jgi:AraC-like DNA-binding protein